jgi:hypothetical protein
MEYEVIDASERPPRSAHKRNPAVDAVIAGETVFISGVSHTSVPSMFKRARRTARIVTRHGERNGVPGVYVWAEPK